MLTGRNIYIRRIEENNLETLWQWYQKPEFREFYTPEAFFLTYSQLKDFLANTAKVHIESSVRIDFIIMNKKDYSVGMADLTAISYRSQHATFSIWIDKKYQNRGYGPEATALILNFAFSELNLIKVSAHIYKENENAIKQAKQFGFQQEGVIRKEVFFGANFHDIVYLSILKEEFYQNIRLVKLLTRLSC